MTKIARLEKLVLDAATLNLAVSEFDHFEGDNAEQARTDLTIESTRALLNLIEFVRAEGGIMRLELLATQGDQVRRAKEMGIRTGTADEEMLRMIGNGVSN